MSSYNAEYWKREALKYKELYEAYYYAKQNSDQDLRATWARAQQLTDRITCGFKKCDEYIARGETHVPVEEMRNALFGTD